MTDEQIRKHLADTGIRIAGETEIPSNAAVKALPYLIIRQKATAEGSDNGFVGFARLEWEVTLFTSDKAPGLNRCILAALQGVGRVEVSSFPDLSPYVTIFKFKTFQT